ncbi:hypothetical protein X975_07035, partial [Stegodyphus mimosarum]
MAWHIFRNFKGCSFFHCELRITKTTDAQSTDTGLLLYSSLLKFFIQETKHVIFCEEFIRFFIFLGMRGRY